MNTLAPSLAPIDITSQAKSVFDNLDVKESTRIDYQYRIPHFITFLNENGWHVNTFLNYKRFLADQNISVSTKNKYLASARVMLKELHRQGMIPDITLNVKSFKQSKRHKKEGLNDDEVQMVLDFIRGRELRLKAIISLMVLHGLRQIEISRLNIESVDLPNKKLFIQAKGSDDVEYILLEDEVVKTLRHYIEVNQIKHGALFVSQSNNSRNQRMSTWAIRNLVSSVFKELGINKSPHGFRHWYTSRLCERYPGNLLMIQQFTRHKSLEMLQVYNDNVDHEKHFLLHNEAFADVRI